MQHLSALRALSDLSERPQGFHEGFHAVHGCGREGVVLRRLDWVTGFR
jgi:hypothetical protein